MLGLGAACRRLITDLMPVFCFSAAYYHFKGQTEIVDRGQTRMLRPDHLFPHELVESAPSGLQSMAS